MPLVQPSHVVSFSSEDPHHPVSNLLNRETYRKWKCKDPGEKEAYVILKFDKAVAFTAVDIGNDGSALVEVSVARSGNDEPQFEVLLGSTAFMSPLDSREGKNLSGVKSFSVNSLSKPIAAQKWDLVKILVSQPFNRHVQYGLTFVKFTAAPDGSEPQKIGMFGLRKPIGGGDSDEDDDVRPGSLFSSTLKSPAGNVTKSASSSSGLSTSAAIRDTSNKLLLAAKSNSEDQAKELLKKPKMDMPSPTVGMSKPSRLIDDSSPLPNRKKLIDPPFGSSGKSSSTNSPSSTPTGKSQSNPSSSKADASKQTKKRKSPDADPRASASSSSSSGSSVSSKPTVASSKKVKKARKTKPYNKLFEGVVFVISGIENPLRGQLRDKAVEMGGRYRQDWDRNCTHLICAYVNTPKFRQVRAAGNGEIVKKDWIEKSYADRCRYPWRRYCLDRNDQGNESEEEIYAEDDRNNDEEVLDDIAMPAETNDDDDVSSRAKRKRVLVMDSSDESNHSDDSKKAYDADTDVDEDITPDLSPSLMDAAEPADESEPFFEDYDFFIYNRNKSAKNSPEEITKLENVIAKHKGRVHKAPSQNVEYYVCHSYDWDEDFSDVLSDNPNIVFVHESWILDCDKSDRLVDKDSYMLSPN